MKRLKDKIDGILNIEIRKITDGISPERRMAIAATIFFILLSGYAITIGYGLYRIGKDKPLSRLTEISHIDIPNDDTSDTLRMTDDGRHSCLKYESDESENNR